jgi:DNA-binding protein H-NS
MKTYKELQAEIKNLQMRAEKARRAEVASVIADIKEKMREYGITEADLSGKSASKKQPKKTGAVVKPKYRNVATGETWTGRGKPPKWIAGQDRNQYLIENNPQ